VQDGARRAFGVVLGHRDLDEGAVRREERRRLALQHWIDGREGRLLETPEKAKYIPVTRFFV
jgi:hypothetical protein